MKRKAIFLLLIFFIILFVLWDELPDHKFHIYFFDVGQGDSVFIETAENHQILIDGGPGNLVLTELSKVMPFFDRSIDLVVLTHPHADHINGLIEVLNRYDVGNVLLTGVSFQEPAYEEFLRILREKEVFIAKPDEDFRFGEVYFDILYPFESLEGEYFENLNNSSIAMMVHYNGERILLTGDLETEGEQELIEAYGKNLKADFFKAGHHGSRTASTYDFLLMVQPKTVIIQSGKDNSFGHPHPETLRNFKRIGVESVRRNDLEGTVELTL